MLPCSVFSTTNVDETPSPCVVDDDIVSSDDDQEDDPVIVDDYQMNDAVRHTKIANKSYIYIASDMLNPDIDLISSDVECVVIMMYKINTDGKSPFLEFGLNSDPDTKECYFMELSREDACQLESRELMKGFMEHNNKAYLFIHIDNEHRVGVQMMPWFVPGIQFAVVDELMNTHTIYDYRIDTQVVDYFDDNRHFLFLHDTDYNVYEIPCVGYVKTDHRNSRFTQVFGTEREDTSSFLGSGFYFTSYDRMTMNPSSSIGKYLQTMLCNTCDVSQNMVICRFLMFLGNMKVILNHPDDSVDSSFTKETMLEHNDTRHHAKMTMRITDHDATWHTTHDSVYVGNLVLDDDSELDIGPIWAVKEHDQQLCLEYRVS